MDIKVETNAQATIDQLRENIAAYKKLLSFQIFRALTVIEANIKNQLRGPSGLKRRTGRLFNTWGETKKVTETANSVVGELSSAGVPYAAIHEFGGVIKAKDKKLTFPTLNNQRPDGSAKISLQSIFASKNYFITKNGTLMQKAGGKSAPTPMFLFRDSVTIPAKPYIRPALAASQDTILKNFGLFISATFKPAKGEE